MLVAMNPDFLLRVIVALAGLALKTSVAFGACVALSRLLRAANLRFVVWSGFVYGSAMYWLYLAYTLWTPHQQVPIAVAGLLQPANASVGAWQIPGSLAQPLGFTLRVIGILYLLTLGYLIFCHVRKRHYLHWVLSLATEPPQPIEQGFRTLAKELHAGRATLLILSGVTSPATFGWLRPTILLPLACVEADRFQLEDILRHELHHVQRWDALWNGLAIASRGLLFFHPAIRYAVRKMHIERELACDLAVVSHSPVRRADYAECLLRFARLNVTPETNSWGLDFAASANHLSLRIQSILAGQKKSPPWLRSLQIACGLTISALFLNVVPSLALFVTFLSAFGAEHRVYLSGQRPGAGAGARSESGQKRKVFRFAGKHSPRQGGDDKPSGSGCSCNRSDSGPEPHDGIASERCRTAAASSWRCTCARRTGWQLAEHCTRQHRRRGRRQQSSGSQASPATNGYSSVGHIQAARSRRTPLISSSATLPLCHSEHSTCCGQ